MMSGRHTGEQHSHTVEGTDPQLYVAVHEPKNDAGLRPVLLCSARVRRHLRRLCEQALPQLAVCSYHEIPSGVRVETTGALSIESVAADAMGVPVA